MWNTSQWFGVEISFFLGSTRENQLFKSAFIGAWAKRTEKLFFLDISSYRVHWCVSRVGLIKPQVVPAILTRFRFLGEGRKGVGSFVASFTSVGLNGLVRPS